MEITAHYIDDDPWTLRGHLIRFLYVPAPHTAERLAKRLSDCLLDWNIDSKLSTITLDNCSTNDSLISLVKSRLSPSNLIKEGALLHMRCSAHILNLIVKDGLDVLKDGIERIRESVLFWTCTPKRVEFFEDTAKQLRVVVQKKLVLDFPTRWNSTYKMKRSRTTLVTTELDHYLADDLHPRSSNFDILNWWSVNGAKYPTLQQIARDFLAVPITSVASESAFSTGGRLLDPHRSRLHHSTVEAMMCARSWIRDEMKGVSEKEKMELEGVFSALVMEDTTVEGQTENTQTYADKEGDARLEE
ncbi:Putative AC transposase [Linum grandiflorum]